MTVKKSRSAKVVAVRTSTTPVYTGNTLTGTRVWATLVTQVIDQGPDHGRLVVINMDPEEALTWAQKIIDVAGQAQTMRNDIGHTP